uniref:FGGY carbohydrate kinase domain-containing protein n=1 Tax=Rhizophora mucronata TaxID=61149 RepID=A0A2P2M1H4_RHIMU
MRIDPISVEVQVKQNTNAEKGKVHILFKQISLICQKTSRSAMLILHYKISCLRSCRSQTRTQGMARESNASSCLYKIKSKY